MDTVKDGKKMGIDEVYLVSKGHRPFAGTPFFTAGDGEEIFSGDIVGFRKDKDIFPTIGTVEDINGLRVACFSQILNKWRYHDLHT